MTVMYAHHWFGYWNEMFSPCGYVQFFRFSMVPIHDL